MPEVYGAAQHIGYLIDMDETAVLKVWDDVHHNIYRINENTGYLVGISDYESFSDNQCTIPQVFYGAPESTTCFRGSPEAARIVYADGSNATGTIQGAALRTYSNHRVRSVYCTIVSNELYPILPDYPVNPDNPTYLCFNGHYHIKFDRFDRSLESNSGD